MITPEEGIRATLARYCMLCDDGRFDEWGRLFTDDARLRVVGATHEGRAAIQAFIEAGQPPEARGRHVVTGSIVEVAADARSAHVWSDYLFVDRSGAITNTGRYHDEMVREADGRWRFALREIVFAGRSPELTGPPPA